MARDRCAALGYRPRRSFARPLAAGLWSPRTDRQRSDEHRSDSLWTSGRSLREHRSPGTTTRPSVGTPASERVHRGLYSPGTSVGHTWSGTSAGRNSRQPGTDPAGPMARLATREVEPDYA